MSWCLPFELCDGDLLCVVGPTASQKTELAIRVCEQVGGEVIGADSVQVYAGFDIGSGKPTEAEQLRVRHHLVGVVDPMDSMDAARYVELADAAIGDVRSRGKVAVVCGGTYLWVRSLVMGLADAPPASVEVRARLDLERAEFGEYEMHSRLRGVDPDIAGRLNPMDWVRVQRALEVFEVSGRRLSDLHREHQERIASGGRYRARLVGVRWDSSALEQRIRLRASGWLSGGWIDEVRGLVGLGYRNSRPMMSVGYRQIAEYLEGLADYETLLDRITRATKVFARRQRTWLREESVVWVDPL